MKTVYIKQIIPALLIFLFTYTAVSKLVDWSFFRTQLSLYPYIRNVASLMALFVPVVELATTVLLFIPATRLWGYYTSFCLLVFFTAYLSAMIITQSDLPCSCGGVIQQMSWGQHIIFNTFFILLSAAGIWLERKAQSPPGMNKLQAP